MSSLPYHKRFHSDALAGFMPLTLEERGAYQTLLDMIYDRGGPLIDNERLLAGYMNCSVRKWRQLREDLIGKGKIRINSDGQITNRRAQKEIENQSKTSRKLVEAGAKGGRTRAEKEKLSNENSESQQASLEAGSSDHQAKPEARSQKPERKEESNLPPDVRAILTDGGYASPPGDLGYLRRWYEAGADLEQDILPVIRRVRPTLRKAPFTLKIFDPYIREKLAADEAEIEHLRRVARRNGAPP